MRSASHPIWPACTKHEGWSVRSDLQAELRIDHFNWRAVILIWGSCANKVQPALFYECLTRPRRLVETDTSGRFCIFQRGWWLCLWNAQLSAPPQKQWLWRVRTLGTPPAFPGFSSVWAERRAPGWHMFGSTVFSTWSLHGALNLLHAYVLPCLPVT